MNSGPLVECVPNFSEGRDADKVQLIAAAITAAGFTIEQCERIAFRSAPLEPRLPYILGRARRT